MRLKIIISQIIVVAGLIAWFKLYLPRLERQHAASEAIARDNRIETFFRWAVIEDRSTDLRPEHPGPEHPGKDSKHPLRLRRSPSLEEIEQDLGVPEGSSGDIRGGTHVTWSGRTRKLEASFVKGRLYSLTLEDRRTGHGMTVFESSSSWHPF